MALQIAIEACLGMFDHVTYFRKHIEYVSDRYLSSYGQHSSTHSKLPFQQTQCILLVSYRPIPHKALVRSDMIFICFVVLL